MAKTQKLDPVTHEILSHRLFQIINEARTALMRVSGSTVVTEGGECMYAIYDKKNRAVMTASGILLHVQDVPIMLQKIVEWWGEDEFGINDGDMFFLNDPYIGGTHAPDQLMAAPLFWKGELCGWLACMTHTTETGAMSPGGTPPQATEIYHEGIRIPALKVVERGKVRNDIFRLLQRSVRDPGMISLDTRAKMAGLNVGRQRLLEIIENYGLGVLDQLFAKLLADTEAMCRRKLESLPDGVWRAETRGDTMGVTPRDWKICCELTKKGDQMKIDFTGTSSQNLGPVNCALPGTIGSVFVALASQLFWDAPWNDGTMAPVELVVPEGSILNCKWPAACSMCPPFPGMQASAVITHCIAKMLMSSDQYRNDLNAPWVTDLVILKFGGLNQWGRTEGVMIFDFSASGTGASCNRDGVDTTAIMMAPGNMIADVESVESKHPLLHLFRKAVADSGGAGKFRGGLSIVHAYLHPHNVKEQLTYTTGGAKSVGAPCGVFGGYPGGSTASVFIKNSNIKEWFDKKTYPTSYEEVLTLQGETQIPVYGMVSPMVLPEHTVVVAGSGSGGAGYGDPIERDPEKVKDDVINFAVTLESATKIYGVILDHDTYEVDIQGTEALRAEIRRGRAKNGKKLTEE